MTTESTLGDDDLSLESLQYLDIPLGSKVDLRAQDTENASSYTTLGQLILQILLDTSSDIGDPHGTSIADRQGRRSIVGLIRSSIRAIDPKFHQNPDTPVWVRDIMRSPILFGSAEDPIRERLTKILSMKNSKYSESPKR